MTLAIRPLTLADVPEFTEVLNASRAHLAPWDPIRDESFYTADGQHKIIDDVLRAGTGLPHVILVDGAIAGRVNLQNIVRGPFQSCSLGYWVSPAHTGRGVASFAVDALLRKAFVDYDLHRVEAATLLHNVRSQRVLAKHGFERFGMAPRYLQIAGDWQDHYLFQVLAENWLAADPARA